MWKKSLLVVFSLMPMAALTGQAAGAGARTMVSADAMQWQEIEPGSPMKITILWGDRNKGEYAMLLKMPAGFVAPIHAHTGDYHGTNLIGSWRHSFEGGEERTLPPGSYVFQPGMEMHGDACAGPEDCILFVHQHVKGDVIPKQ
jgi:quercetin dioxygenase-like cupin family protein